MNSHLQTRTLSDALGSAEDILRSRNTAFQRDQEWIRLERCFAKAPYPKFFDNWVFLAADFEATVGKVAACAPELAKQLVPPRHPNDFTVVGNCSLDLRFDADANGADPIMIQLRSGQRVAGAKVTSSSARSYSNRLVEVPTTSGEKVYFYSAPDTPETVVAAELAHEVFANKMSRDTDGVTLKFPVAKTSRLPDYSWVTKLESTCRMYAVRNFVNKGEALVDHNGFFAHETQVVQIKYRCLPPDLPEVTIDGPFLVFFADDHGIHAAAWFDWDSFGSTTAESRADRGRRT